MFIRRYELLDHIKRNPGIGRRLISEKMDLSERAVRDEIEVLKSRGFVTVSGAGTEITKDGRLLLNNLSSLYSSLNRLRDLAGKVESRLGVQQVYVVKGDSERDPYALSNLGLQGANLIEECLCSGDFIGITGGRTLHAVAAEMKEGGKNPDVTFIPARGGLGAAAEYQANTIVALMASKLGAEYKLLSLPDGIDKEALDFLLRNKEVSDAYRALEKLDLLVFGIGRADNMSTKRGMEKTCREEILRQGAVAEAFGHYFRLNGEEVYRQDSAGLTLEDFMRIPRVIGIAGGKGKGAAIAAISTLRSDMTLVMDEMAAEEILRI